MNKGNPNPTRAGESLRYPRGNPLRDTPVTPSDELIPLTDAQIKARWRSAITANVSEDDMAFIVKRLVECAKRGEAWAMKELVARLAGKPLQSIEVADTTAERQMTEDEARKVLIQFVEDLPEGSPHDGKTEAPPAGPSVPPSNGSTV